MKNSGKKLYLSWKTMYRLAGRHMWMLMVQIIVFCVISCYNVVVVPVIISRVYQALERQNLQSLIITCAVGGVLILSVFVMCYFQNVYLDMNSFRITLTSGKNACRELFGLAYDRVNQKFVEEEIVNRMDACTNRIPGIFPLCVSVLSNVISMGILLVIAGRFSGVLLLLAALAALGSFRTARYESRYQEKYEKEKQQKLDKTGGLLEYTVSHTAFSKMYENENRSWKIYQKERENLWRAMWKQERLRMYTEAFLESCTSVLQGILGWSLFGYYQTGKVASQEVSSSFSIFEQMRSVSGNFSWQMSAVRTGTVAVERFDELIKTGEKIHQETKRKETGRLVSLVDVSYSVKERQILKDVNLSIREGEKIAIFGKNGCGKSTLLRVMAGLYHPESGTVTVEGMEPDTLPPDRLREKITYIPSRSYMYDQTARKNIEMNVPKGREKEELQKVCKWACMEGEDERFLEKRVMEFSGGQIQRVNIARGLFRKAPLLLADEPDAGLPQRQGDLIVKNILENSHTAVVVTHNCKNLECFTRVVILKEGEIIMDKTPEEAMRSREYLEWKGK